MEWIPSTEDCSSFDWEWGQNRLEWNGSSLQKTVAVLTGNGVEIGWNGMDSLYRRL